MARVPYDRLSPEQRRVRDAYERAKANNPRLTQGEFARATMGVSGGRSLKQKPGESERIFRRRQDESAARYLRLVAYPTDYQGRTARALIRRADRGGYQNIELRADDGTVRSFNAEISGLSRIEAYDMLQRAEFDKVVAEQLARWRAQYQGETVSGDPDDYTVSMRPIRRQRGPVRWRVFSDRTEIVKR
jgi:hypothetical protein